jgi:hypothetical protein
MQEKAAELLDPTPELPDETMLDRVRLPTRIHTFLRIYGLKTVGDVRGSADAALIRIPKLGPGSVAHLRKTLGPSSRDVGIRPQGKMAAE